MRAREKVVRNAIEVDGDFGVGGRWRVAVGSVGRGMADRVPRRYVVTEIQGEHGVPICVLVDVYRIHMCLHL